MTFPGLWRADRILDAAHRDQCDGKWVVRCHWRYMNKTCIEPHMLLRVYILLETCAFVLSGVSWGCQQCVVLSAKVITFANESTMLVIALHDNDWLDSPDVTG